MSTHCVKIKSLWALDREKSPVSTFLEANGRRTGHCPFCQFFADAKY